MLSLTLLELSLHEVLADIPHDGDAIVVYVLLAIFAAFIWSGSRRSGREEGIPKREDHVH